MSARPAPVSYAVVGAAPTAVADEVQRIWAANLIVEGGVARKFRWLYEEAPEPAAVVFMLEARGDAAAGDSAARFVGTAGVGVRRFQVGEREVTAALLADLAVDRDHRSLAPALGLVREVKAHALAAHALAYGFPNHNAVGVFKRAGYRPLGTMTRHARVLRHGAYMQQLRNAELPRLPPTLRRALVRAVDLPPLARAGAGALDAARLAQAAPAAIRAARTYRLRWLASADDRVDALWEHAHHEYDLVGRRSAAFLRWRFPVAAGIELAALLDRSGGALAAYAVVQHEGGTAHLRDLFGHHAALGPLLDRLVPALYRRGAQSVSIRYLGAPAITDLLATRGFVARPSERQVLWAARDPALVATSDRWHLLDADEDT